MEESGPFTHGGIAWSVTPFPRSCVPFPPSFFYFIVSHFWALYSALQLLLYQTPFASSPFPFLTYSSVLEREQQCEVVELDLVAKGKKKLRSWMFTVYQHQMDLGLMIYLISQITTFSLHLLLPPPPPPTPTPSTTTTFLITQTRTTLPPEVPPTSIH